MTDANSMMYDSNMLGSGRTGLIDRQVINKAGHKKTTIG